jgi:hypothetical protein
MRNTIIVFAAIILILLVTIGGIVGCVLWYESTEDTGTKVAAVILGIVSGSFLWVGTENFIYPCVTRGKCFDDDLDDMLGAGRRKRRMLPQYR